MAQLDADDDPGNHQTTRKEPLRRARDLNYKIGLAIAAAVNDRQGSAKVHGHASPYSA